MKVILALFCLHLITHANSNADNDCHTNDANKYYSLPGDIYVVGIFDAHFGENCSNQNALYFQQMYDVAAVVRVLNKIKYVPGISIGLSLYDTCASKDIAVKSFVSSLVDADCNFTYNLGVLSTPSAAAMIENLTKVENMPIFTLNYNLDAKISLRVAVELLLELQSSNVDLAVFPNTKLLNTFNNYTIAKNICVKESMTFAHFEGSCPGNNLTVVLAITSSELSFLLKLEIEVDCWATFVIIVLENGIDLSSITERMLLHNVYLIIPSDIWPEFDISVEDEFESIVSIIEENLMHSNVTMNFIRTASTVISVVDRFKQKLNSECGTNATALCPNITTFRKQEENMTSYGFHNVSELLGVDNNNISHYMILKIGFNVVDLFAKVRISSNQVMVDFTNPSIRDEINACEDTDNCKNCSNYEDYSDLGHKVENVFYDSTIKLKSTGWVSSILTICVIGVISCVCVLVFIIVRIYNEDILEGNPCSTFLLLVATILTYLAVIPFCLQIPQIDTLCVAKLFGASFCYCFVFSVILSRILMILTCDYNGSFMSHINGYLQSCLCFFMFAVQIALITEFWVFERYMSNGNFCSRFINSNLFLLYMMYDTFLLVFMATVVPFVTKSRRNYREGLSFSVVTGCFIVVWILWSFGYLMASPESKDLHVAVGLAGTATAVVVCIFIPRTYLIVTGIVRDRITSAIPTSASNIVDMNYRSTQALYDNAVFDKDEIGHQNQGYYDDPQSSTSTSRLDVAIRKPSIDCQSIENNYESCDIPKSEQKITKF